VNSGTHPSVRDAIFYVSVASVAADVVLSNPELIDELLTLSTYNIQQVVVRMPLR